MHVRQVTTACNSSSKASDALSVLCGITPRHVHTNKDMKIESGFGIELGTVSKHGSHTNGFFHFRYQTKFTILLGEKAQYMKYDGQ